MKKLPARVLEDLLEQVVDRKFPYEPKEEKPRDWPAYNRARIKELSSLLHLIQQYVDENELPENRSSTGRPEEISVHEKAKAVLLTEYLQADERTTSGWVNVLGPRIGIVSKMCPRTIGRAYYDDRVIALLELVHKKTSAIIQGKEHSFSGNSTGLKKTNKANWARDKDDDKKHKDFNMLSTMVANNYHVCTSFIAQQGPINNAPTLPLIWQDTIKIHGAHIKEAQFDAGFLSRENIGLVAEHAKPCFFPKRNITLRPREVKAWRDRVWECVTNTQKWLRDYHERSNSEAFNESFEARFPKPLNCKDFKGQGTETTARIVVHNIAQLNVAREEKQIDLTPKHVT